MLDHTNRDGELQGSIAKERVANLSIALRYPDDDAKAEGRVLVEFPVARRLHGADAEPFQLQKRFTETTFSFEVIAAPKIAAPKVPERVVRMAKVVFAKDHKKFSYPEIALKCRIPVATAHGDYKSARNLVGPDKEALDMEVLRLIDEEKRIDEETRSAE